MKNTSLLAILFLIFSTNLFANNYDEAKKLYDQQDFTRALLLFKKSAEKNNLLAQAHLGQMYSDGEGVIIDKKEALKWLLKAAKQGDAVSQNNVGDIYLMGANNVSKDLTKAFYWTEKSALQGLAAGQVNLGAFYFKGWGVTKNKEKAMHWFTQAAKQGDETAVAILSQLGGAEVNDKQTFNVYYKDAKNGSSVAQYHVARHYFMGDGVDKDPSQAVYWFKKSAAQGYSDAQYALGLLYKNGNSVTKDLYLAMSWFNKAAKQGHVEAQKSINQINP